jgi:hypothetical protein
MKLRVTHLWVNLWQKRGNRLSIGGVVPGGDVKVSGAGAGAAQGGWRRGWRLSQHPLCLLVGMATHSDYYSSECA